MSAWRHYIWSLISISITGGGSETLAVHPTLPSSYHAIDTLMSQAVLRRSSNVLSRSLTLFFTVPPTLPTSYHAFDTLKSQAVHPKHTSTTPYYVIDPLKSQAVLSSSRCSLLLIQGSTTPPMLIRFALENFLQRSLRNRTPNISNCSYWSLEKPNFSLIY